MSLYHAGCARGPVPLQLDGDEGVAGKEEIGARAALDADARGVGREASEREEMQRQLDAVLLEAGTGPIHAPAQNFLRKSCGRRLSFSA